MYLLHITIGIITDFIYFLAHFISLSSNLDIRFARQRANLEREKLILEREKLILEREKLSRDASNFFLARISWISRKHMRLPDSEILH